MYNHARFAIAVAITSLFIAPATATTSSMFRLEVPVMQTVPVIDGKVSQQEISQTVHAPLQIINSREKPKNATTVHVGATRQGLYVAFRADETNMDSLTGANTQPGGAVAQDDSVQVLITPEPEVTVDQYYHFAVNPYGASYGRYIQGGTVTHGWEARASINDRNNAKTGAWEAEFFIPLKSINSPEGRPTWRANFARYRPARLEEPAETSAWYNPGISLFNYKRFGFLGMPNFVSGQRANTASNPTSPAPNTTAQTTGTATATMTTPTLTTTTATASQTTDTMPVSVPLPESPQRR